MLIILINVFNILSVGVNSLYKFIYFILYMTLTCKLPTLNKELIIIIIISLLFVLLKHHGAFSAAPEFAYVGSFGKLYFFLHPYN